MRAEGFFGHSDVNFGGQGIGKLLYLIKKILTFFNCKIIQFFGHQNAGSELDPDPYSAKSLDPDLESMNTFNL